MTKFFEKYMILCEETGKTVNRVAKEIGIPSSNVTNWKQGKMPRHESIEKISAYFGVTTDYLLGYTDKKEKSPAEAGDLDAESNALVDKLDYDQLVELIFKATKRAEELKKAQQKPGD